MLEVNRTLSMMLTYQCTAECENCGTLSHPRRKEYISREDALRKIEEAAELGMRLVVFTGGEVTLRWQDLIFLIRESKELGLLTRVVTNGYWATTTRKASEKVKALFDAGLSEMNLSTGDEHAKFVPLDCVVRAAVASAAYMSTVIMMEVRAGNSLVGDSLRSHPVLANARDDLRSKIGIVESPWMPLSPDEQYEYPLGKAANRKNTPLRGGCESALSTYTVQGSGIVGACCGLGLQTIPELNIGNLSTPLEEIINQAEQDLIKRAIRVLGTFRILAWVEALNPSVVWENIYAHHCQACKRIYSDPNIQDIILENIDSFKKFVEDAEFSNHQIVANWMTNFNELVASDAT